MGVFTTTNTLKLLFVSLCVLQIYSLSNVIRDNSYEETHLNKDGDGNFIQRWLETRNEEVKHKDLFPLDGYDYLGTFLIGIGLMIAASGGVGGGGIIVPLLILVFNFHPKYAIALSNFIILGSSVVNMVLNFSKRHPLVNRPLVDWDLILIMEPLTMAGAIVGALVGKVLPDWILVILLVMLLAQTTYETLKKAITQYQKETVEISKQNKSELSKAVDKEIELAQSDESSALLLKSNDEESLNAEVIKNELDDLYESESKTPQDKVVIIIMLVIVVIGLNFIKGGGKTLPSPIGIECGTTSYWFMTFIVFAWILGVSIYGRNILLNKWHLKKRLNYKYITGDIEWNERNTIIYPCICFFAGFFAGMFGIGGGIVKGPLMLQMGVHPLVASGTVAVMIMFTSVSATTMFIAFGTITWDYAWFLCIVGLITTFIGQFGVSYLVQKYKRYSFISFSIGSVVAISTILMAVQSVFSLVDALNSPSSTSTICPK